MRPINRAGLWIWTGGVVAASLIVFLVAVQDFGSSVRATNIALAFWFPAVITLLGTLIAIHQPGNLISWLLLGIGLGILVEFHLQLVADVEPVSPSLPDYAAIVVSYSSFPFVLYLLLLIAFVYPTGRFFTRRQAWAKWLGVIMIPAGLLVAMCTEEIGPPFPSDDQAWTVVNPIGFLPTSALDLVTAIMLAGVLAMAIGAVLSLVTRYRRSQLIVRTQIKWMLFATLVLGAGVMLVLITDATQTNAGGLLISVAFTSIPLSITVAITRYRLFEIDRIISRTLSYSAIVALLGLLFAAGVVWLPTALGLEDSPLLVAGTTLLVAGLFNPLRRRVQDAIDRRFNRSHVEARLVAEQFATQLHQAHSFEEIVDLWLKTVNECLNPETSGIWLREI